MLSMKSFANRASSSVIENDLAYIEGVEQRRERVGLVGRRRSGGQGRAEIAEPGRGDDSTVRTQVRDRKKPPFAALEDAVGNKQGLARSSLRELDCTPGRRECAAVHLGETGASGVQVATVPDRSGDHEKRGPTRKCGEIRASHSDHLCSFVIVLRFAP